MTIAQPVFLICQYYKLTYYYYKSANFIILICSAHIAPDLYLNLLSVGIISTGLILKKHSASKRWMYMYNADIRSRPNSRWLLKLIYLWQHKNGYNFLKMIVSLWDNCWKLMTTHSLSNTTSCKKRIISRNARHLITTYFIISIFLCIINVYLVVAQFFWGHNRNQNEEATALIFKAISVN